MITIEQIKAACRGAIALAESHDITAGPWERDGLEVLVSQGLEVCSFGTSSFSKETDIANARHIAHARTFSPAAARALLGVIDLLEDMATGDGLMGSIARIKLAEICGQWEGQP